MALLPQANTNLNLEASSSFVKLRWNIRLDIFRSISLTPDLCSNQRLKIVQKPTIST